MITGATSMLGATLIEYLINLKEEIKILAICRKDSKRRHYIPKHPNVKVREISLEHLGQFTSKEHYDICFHFAWAGTDKQSREDAYLQSLNIKYTLETLSLAKRLGCHTFIGAGSQAEYGRIETDMAPNTPASPETGYGIAKYSAGKLSALYARQLGIKHIWVRILSVYGPKDGENTMISSTINQLLKGEVPELTPGEQKWDYLYVEDAVRAFWLMAERGKDQSIYCLGSGQARPLKDYIITLKNEINPLLEVGIGKRAYEKRQVMYLCADISKLKEDTGFEPQISFEEGIKRTILYKKYV